jgi:predicted dehydrogenase
MSNVKLSRRAFLGAAAGAVAAPYVRPSSVFGAGAPGSRITVGCVGVGRMGMGDLTDIMGRPGVQVLAVCDVDSRRLANAKKAVETKYAAARTGGSYKGCDAYRDFRELIARPDIDVVQVVTADHWHAIPAVAAAKAGKDVFVQKPMVYSLEEGRVLSDTVRRYGRVLQVGSQQRSDVRFRFACELVRNGRIGQLKTVKVGLPTDPPGKTYPTMPVPPELDYQTWLGPAPWTEYTEERVHPQGNLGRPGWLRVSDYCLGMITAWGSHHVDIAQWGMGTELSGPAEIEGKGEFPTDGLWDVHGRFRVEYAYANGVKLICADDGKIKAGVTFEGSEGWVYVDRGKIDAEPKSLLRAVIGPDDIHLCVSNHHKQNFLDCVRSRREPIASVEVGHRSCSVCILGYIAMRLERRLKWDPQLERFPGDDEANRMLSRPMRAPWHL